MATNTVTADDDGGPLLPLCDAGREMGMTAASEQRELLAVLLEQADSLSGYARRGLLMRVLALADASNEIFGGFERGDEPYVLAATVYGYGTSEAIKATSAIRVAMEASHA